jgi:oligopeptide transport system substrate-binding protein
MVKGMENVETNPRMMAEVDRLFNAYAERQIDRRSLMKGILATGGAAALAMSMPRIVMGQTPDASPVAELYDGPLADEQVMRIPSREPTTMDPGVSFGADELVVFFNIFEGLTGVDQRTGEVVPRLAESWEENEDATEFTFTIRQDAMWSDGTPINAHDFVNSWRRVLDPNTLSEYLPAMYPILNAEAIVNGEMDLEDLGVEAVDDFTLRVQLEASTPYFPLLATTWTFNPVPLHVIESAGDQWVEAENIVSSGPYKMVEWNHDQSIILEINENYYGEKPTVTRGEIRLFEDPSTQAYIAFENDELDYAAPEGPDLDRVLADPELSSQLITFPLSNCFFVVVDTRDEFGSKKEFRQALYKSIDRETLTQSVLNGQFDSAYTVLPPDIPGHNPDAALTESDEEAVQLLADAGIDPASVNISIVYQNSPARYATVCEYLQSRWQEVLGITVTLEPIEANTYIDWRASRETQPYNLYTGTWGSDFGDPSNWHNQNFTSQADHYRNHWQNEEFDSLCAEAASNTDMEAREEQYRQAEAILVEEAPIIPMYRTKAFRAVKPWVKDLALQPILSSVHFRYVKIAPRDS